jgi:uncharacterized protein (TIGR02246 family)
MTPEEFSRLFASAFAAQDFGGLADMLADDAEVVTLTGAHAENKAEAEQVFAAEFAGAFAHTRLVSGKTRLRPLGPGGAIVHQRFVVIGVLDADGQEIPRFGALLTTVLLARAEGWRAVSLAFSALA